MHSFTYLLLIFYLLFWACTNSFILFVVAELVGTFVVEEMRFMKGDKVEVLNMCEVPSGSWRCATIISGNGRRYIVTYVERSPEGGFNVDRVPRNAMRPTPPPVGGLENLLPDDIVEVFCSGSWKVASVIGTVDGMHFFVRPHGSGQELHVHKTNLRLRQSWQDGQWFVVGKVGWLIF